LAYLVAGWVGLGIAGCAGPPEKKVDQDEMKRQIKQLENDLRKEKGEN
jgi:hypothetical protein